MNPTEHLIYMKIKLNIISLLKNSSSLKEFVPDVNWIALGSTGFNRKYSGAFKNYMGK
jgi:hypothetical protein